jgi:putative peptide zinc metalloprotease protein
MEVIAMKPTTDEEHDHTPETEPDEVEITDEVPVLPPDLDGATAAGDQSDWDPLRPLEPDDLAALDPSALEGDLAEEEDREIVDVADAVDVGPASTRTADDLTSDTILRVSPRPPQSGWRRFVYDLTGGMIRPRLSRSERARVEQLSLIRTLVTHPRRIAVVSRKGGVGKTTTTLMLGHTLASERGDRIVAVDGNPDAGNLGYRVGGVERGEASITDLLSEMETVERYADMRRYATQTPTGLEVLTSDDDPQISTALGEQEYAAVMSLLDRFYNLVLVDTGTGILDSAVQGILDGTDQIVLVVAPSLDAARAASQTLDWLTEHGFVELVETAVTVINQVRRSALVDIGRIEEHFWDRCGATVRIPWDQYLEAGAETELADLRPATREAYLQLAAEVARRFED